VYAAREPFDSTATHDALAAAVNAKGGHAQGIKDFEETTALLKTLEADVVAFTMGAGDVYKAGEAALGK
jgi:UDP-N-acetylmuramate-alanine ligase